MIYDHLPELNMETDTMSCITIANDPAKQKKVLCSCGTFTGLCDRGISPCLAMLARHQNQHSTKPTLYSWQLPLHEKTAQIGINSFGMHFTNQKLLEWPGLNKCLKCSISAQIK